MAAAIPCPTERSATGGAVPPRAAHESSTSPRLRLASSPEEMEARRRRRWSGWRGRWRPATGGDGGRAAGGEQGAAPLAHRRATPSPPFSPPSAPPPLPAAGARGPGGGGRLAAGALRTGGGGLPALHARAAPWSGATGPWGRAEGLHGGGQICAARRLLTARAGADAVDRARRDTTAIAGPSPQPRHTPAAATGPEKMGLRAAARSARA